MKLADLAFVNRQLAGMVRGGQPLEGALKELCREMARGDLKRELTRLEEDLARGIPLAKAVEDRDLPVFYKGMIRVGARSGDLPGVLLMLANYYAHIGIVWDRLKAALFYPILVLLTACGVSVAMATIIDGVREQVVRPDLDFNADGYSWFLFLNWLPPIVLACAAMGLCVAGCSRSTRGWIKWRFPVLRNTATSQFASALALLLRRGIALGEAVEFLADLEQDSPLGRELRIWHRRIREGMVSFSAIGERPRVLPSMFVWLLEQRANDLPGGLENAAQLYAERAERQTEWMLEAAAPVGLAGLGLIVCVQVFPVFWWLTEWFQIIDQI